MNPYEILGIPENATEEQIKDAYRELVKKYHPDKYQDNPLADLAEEKMQEINEAYDTLMKNAGSGSASYDDPYSTGGSSYGSTGHGGRADYLQVRRNIDTGNIAAAETILRGSTDRSAEWYFLSGVVALRKGWYDEAANMLQTACNMEPTNMEYRRHLASLRRRPDQYQNTAAGKGYSTNNDMCCQALQCYLCASCCCGGCD